MPSADGVLQTDHISEIRDLAYDFYGRRLATAGNDARVHIWEPKIDSAGEWRNVSTIGQGHNGPIGKVAWAHPEFGQILATGSDDRSAVIWEEELRTDSSRHRSWRLAAKLVDSKKQIRDLEFAPRHLGLQLATASADGTVRIYEAQDIMNLEHWPIMHEIEVAPNKECWSLSWCKSRAHQTMLATGDSSGLVKIWTRDEDTEKWHCSATKHMDRAEISCVSFAPNLGRSFNYLAVGTAAGSVYLLKVESKLMSEIAEGFSGIPNPNSGEDSSDMKLTEIEAKPMGAERCSIDRLAWNATGALLAVCNSTGALMMLKLQANGRWTDTSIAKLGELDA
eukprot:Clim_evm19s147 gene=Clim_evmTU19s147